MHIRLVRKLADCLDGIDVSAHRPGDIIELPRRKAQLLVAEGWALPAAPALMEEGRAPGTPDVGPSTDDLATRTLELIHRIRREFGRRHYEEQERRRAEDRIREELHDERAKTIKGWMWPRQQKAGD